jgi:hypothetical protein
MDLFAMRDEFIDGFLHLATVKGWLLDGADPKSGTELMELCQTYGAGYALAMGQIGARNGQS